MNDTISAPVIRKRMQFRGTEEQIDRVILAVEQGLYVRIENMSAEIIPLQDERGFHVR